MAENNRHSEDNVDGMAFVQESLASHVVQESQDHHADPEIQDICYSMSIPKYSKKTREEEIQFNGHKFTVETQIRDGTFNASVRSNRAPEQPTFNGQIRLIIRAANGGNDVILDTATPPFGILLRELAHCITPSGRIEIDIKIQADRMI